MTDNPEPSEVWGIVTLRDPSTREAHVIYDYSGPTPVRSTLIDGNVSVARFVRRDDPATEYSLSISPAVEDVGGWPGIGLRYRILFEHNTAQERVPYVMTTRALEPMKISYNPTDWHFTTVDLAATIGWMEVDAAGNANWYSESLPLAAQATPIPEFAAYADTTDPLTPIQR